MPKIRFETLGNATIQLFADGRPVLVTDPWLRGTCYFGSWELERPPSPAQVENAVNSDFVWISHGHPDHLHDDSLALFRPGTRFLVAEQYNDEIVRHLEGKGFAVSVMRYREWVDLGHGVEILGITNPDQDTILVIRTPDALIINLNDCQLWGEDAFLRRLVRQCPTDKTFLLALSDFVGDMRNIVDAEGRWLPVPFAELKQGAVRLTARLAARLGVTYYCCSSFQHRYAREDAAWANAGKIKFEDLARWWVRPEVTLVPPFVTVDLGSMAIAPSGPDELPGVPSGTWEDDWHEPLGPGEWERIEAFFRRFETLRGVVGFIAVTVAGERRDFRITPGDRRGVHFRAPRRSLMAAVEAGYFDDLLLGNFMRTELIDFGLYPDFTPLIAKLGGNAGVTTGADLRRFRRHYRRRNRWADLRWRASVLGGAIVRRGRRLAHRLGIESPARAAYWRLRGDRPVSQG